MSFKDVVFYIGCVASWVILLPALVVGGAIALVAYALFTELSEILLGSSESSLDTPTAREIARRVCLGH
jgi:hypothetical protein